MATMDLDWHQFRTPKREHTCIIINKQRLTSYTHIENDKLRMKSQLFSLLHSTLSNQQLIRYALSSWNLYSPQLACVVSDVFRFEERDCSFLRMRTVDGASPLNSHCHPFCFIQTIENRFRNAFGFFFFLLVHW